MNKTRPERTGGSDRRISIDGAAETTTSLPPGAIARAIRDGAMETTAQRLARKRRELQKRIEAHGKRRTF